MVNKIKKVINGFDFWGGKVETGSRIGPPKGENITNFVSSAGAKFNFYKRKIKMMNNENGRSMVEMLGVLAIIGVLSVAGIAGYSMAMKKYRANEIVNAASQVAVLALAKFETTGSTSAMTAAEAGYSGNIGGIAAANISAKGNEKTITIDLGNNSVTGTDIAAIVGTNCQIGDFTITTGCTSS